jgi:hypothetical protein
MKSVMFEKAVVGGSAAILSELQTSDCDSFLDYKTVKVKSKAIPVTGREGP